MSKPRNGYRPDLGRRSHAHQQKAVATCETCGKRAYATKATAKRSARVLYPEQRMRVYPCGPWWHLTSQDAARTEQMRDHYAGSPDEPAA